MARVVNIAFEGGGARLVTLLAAAHAVSELERDGDLHLGAVSGSSAGSLAAFLLGSKRDFEDVKKTLKRKDGEIRQNFPTIRRIRLWWRGLLFYFLGLPIFAPNKFNDIVTSVLESIGVNTNISLSEYCRDCKIHIFVSDIYQHKSIACDLQKPVRDALRDSCAIPFVFASYRNDNRGQYVDGGVFDNLPTEILMDSSHAPVFAIGFEPEKVKAAKSATDYLLSLVSSVVSHRVSESRQSVGEERVLLLSTTLGTFDFDKMVSIGIEEEYDFVKRQTHAFFSNWLAGLAQTDVPTFETRGRGAAVKLEETETKLIAFVEDVWRHVTGANIYVRLRVDANCLMHPNIPDEIQLEQLIRVPDGQTIPGIILPLIGGAGLLSHAECFVHLDGPKGEAVPIKQFIVHDNVIFNGEPKRRMCVVILLCGGLNNYSGRSLYVLKKEKRFGFMAPLKSPGQDYLGCRSHYWDSEEISVQLNVPADFGAVHADWIRDGEAGSGPEEQTVPPLFHPAHTNAHYAVLRTVPHRTGLRANFKRI